MKKRFTLLSTAILLGSTFSAFAVEPESTEVNPTEWKAGHYYYLKSGDNYLTLDPTKTDSVIVKTSIESESAKKSELDLALWQITSKSTSAGPAYQFVNKGTKATLAFSAKVSSDKDGNMKLDPKGISEWSFSDGKIVGYSGDKTIALVVSDNKLKLEDNVSSATTEFGVNYPDTAFALKAEDLGAGISTFFMDLNGKYDGDIFSGKELIAKNETVDDLSGYVSLQYKGDEEFSDGKAKYLGVDTVYTKMEGQENVFGLKFKADSTYKYKEGVHSWDNTKAQRFKFTIDLKTDSVAMYVRTVRGETKGSYSEKDVRVVYATFDEKNVLTVAEVESDGKHQGTAPFITTKRGTPATLANDGVYFLKNAGAGDKKGQYLFGANFEAGKKPSVFLPEGQWYVKAKEGRYSIVSRSNGKSYADNVELFPVKGIENAYTVTGKTDTLAFEYQKNVDLKNEYLGVLHFTDAELKEKTIELVINAVGGSVPVSVSDSLLVVKNGEEAQAFRLVKDKEEAKGGAQSLGDTLRTVSYKLVEHFGKDSVIVTDEDVLAVSSGKETTLLSFTFQVEADGREYVLKTSGDKYVSYNAQANLMLSEKETDAAKFAVNDVDAPEYEVIESDYVRLESNGKYLTMNPYTFLAEMKSEGQEITRAEYTADNFSLKIEAATDTTIAGKPVYRISTGIIGEDPENATRYYLSAIDSIRLNGNMRLGFTADVDTVNVSDSPTLFAFKTTENGTLLLENIKNGTFVTLNGNDLVLAKTGMDFTAEKAEAPTANETIDAEMQLAVIGGHNTVTILNAKDKKVILSDILGKIVGNYTITSDRFTVSASRGIVIVAVEGEIAQKVLVK